MFERKQPLKFSMHHESSDVRMFESIQENIENGDEKGISLLTLGRRMQFFGDSYNACKDIWAIFVNKLSEGDEYCIATKNAPSNTVIDVSHAAENRVQTSMDAVGNANVSIAYTEEIDPQAFMEQIKKLCSNRAQLRSLLIEEGELRKTPDPGPFPFLKNLFDSSKNETSCPVYEIAEEGSFLKNLPEDVKNAIRNSPAPWAAYDPGNGQGLGPLPMEVISPDRHFALFKKSGRGESHEANAELTGFDAGSARYTLSEDAKILQQHFSDGGSAYYSTAALAEGQKELIHLKRGALTGKYIDIIVRSNGDLYHRELFDPHTRPSLHTNPVNGKKYASQKYVGPEGWMFPARKEAADGHEVLEGLEGAKNLDEEKDVDTLARDILDRECKFRKKMKPEEWAKSGLQHLTAEFLVPNVPSNFSGGTYPIGHEKSCFFVDASSREHAQHIIRSIRRSQDGDSILRLMLGPEKTTIICPSKSENKTDVESGKIFTETENDGTVQILMPQSSNLYEFLDTLHEIDRQRIQKRFEEMKNEYEGMPETSSGREDLEIYLRDTESDAMLEKFRFKEEAKLQAFLQEQYGDKLAVPTLSISVEAENRAGETNGKWRGFQIEQRRADSQKGYWFRPVLERQENDFESQAKPPPWKKIPENTLSQRPQVKETLDELLSEGKISPRQGGSTGMFR